jgi:hypothetical protein
VRRITERIERDFARARPTGMGHHIGVHRRISGVKIVIRKLALGLAAAVVIAGAALAPTAASAGGGMFWPHHHHHSHFFIAPATIFVGPPPSCFQKRLVQTFKGLRWRTVNVCAY